MQGARRAFIALSGALVLSMGLLSQAGVSADLRGRVVDPAGAPLPGTTVVLRSESLAVPERATLTDREGQYRFLNLPPGPGYQVRATFPNYAPVEFTEVLLESSHLNRLDFTLRPSSEVRETIRVPGRVATVDTESVVTSTTLSSEFIAGLPVLGQDYQDILTLAPGVTDVNDTGNPNIHGARDTNVLTLVDGVNTTDPLTGHFGQFLNIDSIEEIEVITAGAGAEYSRAQGGFVNIVTKSGGNEFRGTFKLFVRNDRLDGDGAGIDDTELRGGLGDGDTLRDLSFTDLYPFLSLSGPIAKDRVWYFLANEYVQVETPINAGTQAFVTRTRGYREFGKVTWQMAPSHKLAFTAHVDRTTDENQGLDSFSDPETGYSFERGGPTYTLKETSVFGSNVFLESSVSWFDNSFQRRPTLDPDTNGNGIRFVDDRPGLGGNQDGFFQARERDPGEDYDQDGAFDVWEDENGNTFLDGCEVIPDVGVVCEEDLDGDGRLTRRGSCEGVLHEDQNCNGILDSETDRDGDGVADPDEDLGIPCLVLGLCPDGVLPGTRGNGVLDTEDRNLNGELDVVGDSGLTPFPFWEDTNGNGYPDPGEFLAPVPPDRNYVRNRTEGGRISEDDPINPLQTEGGRITGPNPFDFEDHRKRFTLREDLSIYVNDFLGSHELKLGALYEHEAFDRTTELRPFFDVLTRPVGPIVGILLAVMPTIPTVDSDALSDSLGLYLQDTYKPLHNLSLGLGLRFDFEKVGSSGFTFFDPRAEGLVFQALSQARGIDTDNANQDSVIPQGLVSDPIYTAGSPRLASLNSALATIALNRLTRHEIETDIQGVGASNAVRTESSRARRPDDFRITNSNLSPRFSVSWDPWGDGRTKAFASWSRYYDKLFLNAVTVEKGLDTVTRYYAQDLDGVDPAGRPNNQVGSAFTLAPPSAFQINRNLKTPFTDELTIGMERELAPEVSLSLTYIRRDFRDQLQNIDVNHHTLVDKNTGRTADLFGTQVPPEYKMGQIPPGVEIERRLPDGRPDLFIWNPFFNRVFRIGNFNEQTYRGYEVELTRRLNRQWQMQASYVFSRSEGDAETFLSVAGDDPSLTEFESGYLSFDQTHVVKLNALTYLPGDWQMGATIQWSSGLPFSVIDEFWAMDDAGYIQERRRFGQPDPEEGFKTENRNIHRNRAVYDFNARVQKGFVIGKASAAAFFEIFNLLNSDDLRVFTVDPSVRSLQADQVRRFGRRYQLGVRVDF